MKYLRAFRSSATFKTLLVVLSFIGILYQLLFSPWGNALLAPILERVLSSALSNPVTLQRFTLTHNRFDLHANDASDNLLSVQGGFSLLTLRLYGHYRIESPKSTLAPFAFHAEGSLSGGYSAFEIQGTLEALKGRSLYHITFRRAHLAALRAQIEGIDYESLLHALDYPSSTDTALFALIELKGFERRNVEGSIHLSTRTERFEPTEQPDDDNGTFDLRSWFADENGRIPPFRINVALDASLEHAGILEPFVPIPLATHADAQALLSGNHRRLELNATTTLARSDTRILLSIADFEPERLSFSIRHADAAGLFGLFAREAPLGGSIDAQGLFTPEQGEIRLALSDARTLPAVLKRDYNLTQPPLRFDADLTARTDASGVRYRGRLISDLKRLEFADSAPHDAMLGELLKTFR